MLGLLCLQSQSGLQRKAAVVVVADLAADDNISSQLRITAQNCRVASWRLSQILIADKNCRGTLTMSTYRNHLLSVSVN